MSRQLIDRNADLRRLRDKGFEIEVRSGLLLVHAVPYVTSRREVTLGILVSELTMAAPDQLDKPGTHQIHFIGEHPCKPDGTELVQIKNSSGTFALAEGVVANHYFSHKPRSGGYADYYEKVSTYVRVISDQARAIDPTADARTFKTVESVSPESVFLYEDTASSRAGVRQLASMLGAHTVAIVGLGGTGAYVLDLIAKTHVREIHLFDGDVLRQHNAFRVPGAISRAALEKRQNKAAFWADVYGAMRRGVVPHEVMITENNAHELSGFDTVFLCVDKGTARQAVFAALADHKVVVIDAGMGVQLSEDGRTLIGICRVTTSTPETRERALATVPSVDRADDLYGANIQIADLNCLNATMAVIRWKRLVGFYWDVRNEVTSTFTVASNQLANTEATA